MTNTTPEAKAWNNRFATEDYIFGTAPNAFLASEIETLKRYARPGATALAIADGEGRNGVFLASLGFDVLSLDVSENALDKARKLAATRGVPLRTAVVDLVTWNWPLAAFDVIAGIFFQFCGPPERDRIFAGIGSALKPGGLLLLEGYRPEQLGYKTGGPPFLDRFYTRELLESAFAGLTSRDIRIYDADITEGTAHKGRSALIDMVAVK